MFYKQDNSKDDPFDKHDLESLHLSSSAIKWSQVKKHLFNVVLGREKSPVRTTNLLHVLASVTVS